MITLKQSIIVNMVNMIILIMICFNLTYFHHTCKYFYLLIGAHVYPLIGQLFHLTGIFNMIHNSNQTSWDEELHMHVKQGEFETPSIENMATFLKSKLL